MDGRPSRPSVPLRCRARTPPTRRPRTPRAVRGPCRRVASGTCVAPRASIAAFIWPPTSGVSRNRPATHSVGVGPHAQASLGALPLGPRAGIFDTSRAAMHASLSGTSPRSAAASSSLRQRGFDARASAIISACTRRRAFPRARPRWSPAGPRAARRSGSRSEPRWLTRPSRAPSTPPHRARPSPRRVSPPWRRIPSATRRIAPSSATARNASSGDSETRVEVERERFESSCGRTKGDRTSTRNVTSR